MDIKELPEMQQITNYLKAMKFRKKTVGGCDMDDVLDHMSKVTEMYNECLERVTREAEGGVSAREKILESEYRMKIEEYENEYAAKVKEFEDEYQAKVKELDARHRAERANVKEEQLSKADQLIGTLEQVDNVCKALKSQAEREAEEIVRKAQIEAAGVQEKADDIVRQAEEEAAEVQRKARRKAEKIAEEARVQEYEARRQAQEAAERLDRERAEHERNLAQIRAKSTMFCSDMQKALDYIQVIQPQLEGEEG